MKLNKNIIAFQKNAVCIPDIPSSFETNTIVATVNSELMQFGYMLSKEAYEHLSKCHVADITQWANDIISYLKGVLGEGNYRSFHPGFPQTVKAMPEFELYMKAILHYWSQGTWIPEDIHNLEQKGYKYEHVTYVEINPMTENEFMSIFTELVSVNQALSPQNNDIVEWFIDKYDHGVILPKTVPFKETMCKLASFGIPVPVKTSTDVLRIATYLSYQSTDLIIPKKKIRPNAWSSYTVDNPEYLTKRFKNFTRKERRYLLGLLDIVANKSEMVLKKGMWLRLGEKLHPGEYSKRYTNAFNAFNALRNENVKSWYSRLENAMKSHLSKGISVLKERPGEFARRLDATLRNNPFDLQYILDEFSTIANKVSNKVLFELINHFTKRNEEQIRKIFIKGSSRKATKLPSLETMHPQIIEKITQSLFKTISYKLSQKPSLGYVYIDERLKNVAVPLSMRGVSFSTRPIVRGTRIPLDVNKKTLRAYVHWTAGVDLDLSVELFNNKDDKTTCSYHNLRPCKGIYHSGDVIPRVKGNWAEYVDIVLDEIPYDFALLQLRNYGGGTLKDQGAVLGFMEREYPEQNPTWYPKTITSAYQLNTNSSNSCLALIDIKNKEWVLIDEDQDGIPISFGADIEEYVQQYINPPKFSAYDLLKLHADHRGFHVLDKENVNGIINTEFKFEDFIETYESIYKYMED